MIAGTGIAAAGAVPTGRARPEATRLSRRSAADGDHPGSFERRRGGIRPIPPRFHITKN